MPAAGALAYPRKGRRKRKQLVKQNHPFCSARTVPGAPRGQRTQNDGQGQTAEPEGDRQDKTKTGEKGGNVRDKASIPTNSIQDKINHPFYLQGALKPLQAILAEAEQGHRVRS